MHLSERSAFEALIDELADVSQISDGRIDRVKRAYFDHLSDVTLEKIHKSVLLSIRTTDGFPTINRLRTLAGASEDDHCQDCIGSPASRERHLKQLTEGIYEQSRRDIPLTLELVFSHARTNAELNPQIRTWVKQAIADMEGWSTLPRHLQPDTEQARIAQAVEAKGYRPGKPEIPVSEFIGKIHEMMCSVVANSDMSDAQVASIGIDSVGEIIKRAAKQMDMRAPRGATDDASMSSDPYGRTTKHPLMTREEAIEHLQWQRERDSQK
jgi:hypothetical protein